ncbi:MAG: hypothetical protein ACK2UW_23505 [Anaerolineales bacterium]|jgi:hypothetical protein
MVLAKITGYRQTLRALPQWEPYLLEHSGLPGPRANLELAQAAAEEGRPEQFAAWRRLSPQAAPVNSPEEFLVFCGVLGLGWQLAAGDRQALADLQAFASDPRWRTREAVAQALQQAALTQPELVLAEMHAWAAGTPLEQRAAAAAICEPALIEAVLPAAAVFDVLDRIMIHLPPADMRRSQAFRTLRQGLGYCWSVAVAAAPEPGKARMERWLTDPDMDIQWIMRTNLQKKRLERLDPDWTDDWQQRLKP